MPSCIASPQQTEGPYFVDLLLDRSDIRIDRVDGTVVEGIPLRLQLNVSEVAIDTCEYSPLAGATVDVWQCDALGNYSAITNAAGQVETSGAQFLRGFQVSDDNGNVEFTTIYPGWYTGRAVHIHLKVRTAPGTYEGLEFTSQLYFDDALTDFVHSLPPYNAKGWDPLESTCRHASLSIL